MLDGRAYIVILQKHDAILRVIDHSIRAAFPDGPHNRIEFCSAPRYAMALVAKDPVDIVITGDYFDKKDSYFEELDQTGKKHRGIIQNATNLVSVVRRVRPDTLVLRYSSCPRGQTEGLVGDIDKDNPSQSLDTILAMVGREDLASILKRGDWKALREAFPSIAFYDTLEKYYLPLTIG